MDPRKAGAKRLQTKAAPGVKWSNRGHPLPDVPHCRIALDAVDKTDAVPGAATVPDPARVPAPKRKRPVTSTKKAAALESVSSIFSNNDTIAHIAPTSNDDTNGAVHIEAPVALPSKRSSSSCSKRVRTPVVKVPVAAVPEVITADELKKCACTANPCTMPDVDASHIINAVYVFGVIFPCACQMWSLT